MKNNIDGSDINVGSIDEEIKVGDIVELKSKHIGKVININEFREPSMKYGIDIKGFRDIAFVGEYAIARKIEDNIEEDIEKLKWERDYYKLRFEELNKQWERVRIKLLGENYYNDGCDWKTCDEFMADDLIYKYKKRWWQFWKKI